jgi:serine/threonine-protein kinase
MGGLAPCPIAEDLERFLLGQLSEEEALALEQHLARCPACVSRLASLHPRDGLVDVLSDVARSDTAGGEVDAALVASLVRLGRAEGPPGQPAGGATTAEGPGELLAPSQQPGEVGRVGPYRVLRLLGSGGMGVVYQAEQPRPRRVVALKMILAGPHPGPDRLARFRRETEVAARLEHPNIVPIYEAGEHDGQPYFTMEYLPGGSLAQKSATPPPPARAASLVETLARAVHFAHERGFVHRDLKPSNVLLSADGTPKITDFGLAKQLAEFAEDLPESATQSGAILGTPGYMAPEQASGGVQDVGPAADVWALGAILYELLTGRPPFRAATLLATLEQTRARDPVTPSRLHAGLPRDLETICLKCLHKEPARRYASAAELAEDLGRFRRGEPIRARPLARRERLLKWVRRRPALATLLAVSGLSLIVLVAGAIFYNARLQQARQRADRNYRQAREAVQRMLSRLERRDLAGTPRLKELQRQQLEDALVFYQEVLHGLDSSTDPAVRFDVALACEQAGSAQLLLGRLDPAQENLARACQLLATLAAEDPGRPEYRIWLAACHHKLGAACLDQHHNDAAEQHYREALALQERLAAEDPTAPVRQNGLAQAFHNLGTLLQLTRREALALAEYVRAAEIRRRLVQDHPAVAEYRALLAEDCLNLGLAYEQTHRPAEAPPLYREAEALLEPLVREHPERLDDPLSLAGVYNNWSRLLGDRPKDALAMLNKAVTLAEGVLRQEPQYGAARARTFQSHGRRAQINDALGRTADAVRDWERVVELDTTPQWWVHRVFLAQALARAAEHVRAAAEAKTLEQEPAVTDDGRFELARVYVLSLAPARADPRLSPQEQSVRAEGYAARAVALLRRLHAAGYFKEPGHAELLRTDPDLAPLRGRADFRNLEGSK